MGCLYRAALPLIPRLPIGRTAVPDDRVNRRNPPFSRRDIWATDGAPKQTLIWRVKEVTSMNEIEKEDRCEGDDAAGEPEAEDKSDIVSRHSLRCFDFVQHDGLFRLLETVAVRPFGRFLHGYIGGRHGTSLRSSKKNGEQLIQFPETIGGTETRSPEVLENIGWEVH
jgi:hypothetical protein